MHRARLHFILLRPMAADKSLAWRLLAGIQALPYGHPQEAYVIYPKLETRDPEGSSSSPYPGSLVSSSSHQLSGAEAKYKRKGADLASAHIGLLSKSFFITQPLLLAWPARFAGPVIKQAIAATGLDNLAIGFGHSAIVDKTATRKAQWPF